MSPSLAGNETISPRKAAILAKETTYQSGKQCRNGHNSARFTASGMCCECGRLNQRKRYEDGARASEEARKRANKRWNASEKARAAKRRWEAKDPKHAWAVNTVGRLRIRAKQDGVPFAITAEDLKAAMTTHCPALGCELVYGSKTIVPAWNSASVDKIIPQKGYVIGNVAVISYRANAIKHDASPDEVMNVARWLASATGN